MGDESDPDDDWAAAAQMQALIDAENAQTTINKELTKWHAFRRHEYGMTQIDTTHNCTDSNCMSRGRLEAICHDLSLYGCLHSGLHHVCRGSSDSCPQYYIASDRSLYCIFSRAHLSQSISRSHYGKQTDDEHQGGVRALGGDDGDGDCEVDFGDEDGFDGDAALDAEADLEFWGEGTGGAPRLSSFGAGAHGAAAAGNDLTHYDSLIINRPQTAQVRPEEAERFGMQMVVHKPEPPPLPPSFSVQTTSSSSATRTRSKRIQKVANEGQSATDNRRKKALANTTREKVKGVVSPLFNSRQRLSVSFDRQAVMEADATDRVGKYVRVCAQFHRPHTIHSRDALIEQALSRSRLLFTDTVDNETVDRYIAFVLEAWRVCVETDYFAKNYVDFRLVDHTLGVLFTLADSGVSMLASDLLSVTEVLPPDPFLSRMLPEPSQLIQWAKFGNDFSVKNVTRGRNVFKGALNSITQAQHIEDTIARLKTAYFEGKNHGDENRIVAVGVDPRTVESSRGSCTSTLFQLGTKSQSHVK